MIADHVALSYRIGSVKEIPTWLNNFHLVALFGFYAQTNFVTLEKQKCVAVAIKFSA